MIWDISPPIFEGLAVWPGDMELSKINNLQMEHGDNINLTAIKTTVHLGAHADAPKHFVKEGLAIGEVSLEPYLGICQVIEVAVEAGQQIETKDLANKTITASRVLFKTNSLSNLTCWNTDFNAFSKEVIEYLASQNVYLVGIDTPSVDPFDAKILTAHETCFKHNIAILEGLVLTNIQEGNYQLIALPLKLMEFDASPVRAVLVSL